MLVLVIETSTPVESVAVVRDGTVLAEFSATVGRGHTEALLGAIEGVMRDSGTATGDLDAIAVSIGPGRFSGLRVGLATAKGLAAPTGIPIVPVGTLEALAESARPHRGLVCPMLDARRGEVYGAVFRLDAGRERVLDAAALSAEALLGRVEEVAEDETVMFLGSGAALCEDAIRLSMGGAAVFAQPSIEAPTPAALASMAEEGGDADGVEPADLEPVYLRGI